MNCLWLVRYSGRVKLLRQILYDPQSLKIYFLALYRKSSLILLYSMEMSVYKFLKVKSASLFD